jgi:large subunit ribosomal protein L24
VISGKDRGKTGKVVRAFPQINKVLVESVNIQKRHQRARRAGAKGQIIERAMPVHVSNVMFVDPQSGKGTRLGFSIEKGAKMRMARKSKATIS